MDRSDPQPVIASVPSWFHGLRMELATPDPTGNRWILATKTVCAVVSALLLFRHEPNALHLLGATCAAFLMQCVGRAVGPSPSTYQYASVVVSGVTMAILMALVTGLHQHPYIQDAVFIGIAFGVFQVRRVLPDHATFPLFLFTTTVVSAGLAETTLISPWAAGSLPLAALLVVLPLTFLIVPRLDVATPAALVSWRTPFRAALAALAAILVQHLLDLPRAYWSLLVAVVVTSETSRDLLVKSTDRLVMTILGCLIGLLLHLAVRDAHFLQMTILAISIFGAAFFRPASTRLMVACLSVYVVFLFAVIGQWDIDIVLVRIYDTAIGCAVGLLVPLAIPFETPAQVPASGTTAPPRR